MQEDGTVLTAKSNKTQEVQTPKKILKASLKKQKKIKERSFKEGRKRNC